MEEWKCYRECCGASQFDFVGCNDYNTLHEQKRRASLGGIIAGTHILDSALSISATGLLIATIIFAVKFMKCCHKPKDGPDNQTQEAGSSKGKESAKWKPCQFNNEYECFECKELGAFVMLPCGKLYHMKCLNPDRWGCTHCTAPIAKVKLYCIACLEYSVMLGAATPEGLEEAVAEAYCWHAHRCF